MSAIPNNFSINTELLQATPAQMEIINGLISGTKYLSEPNAQLLQRTITDATKITANATTFAGAKALSGVVAKGSMASSALSGIMVATGTGIVILGIGYSYALTTQYLEGLKKDYKKWVSNCGYLLRDVSFKIVEECFRDEIVSKSKLEVAEYVLCKMREDKFFQTWIKLQGFKVLANLDKGWEKNEQKYKDEVKEYIKEEKIESGEFQKLMKLYCACHKVLSEISEDYRGNRLIKPSEDLAGEFKNSKKNENRFKPFYSKDKIFGKKEEENPERKKLEDKMIKLLKKKDKKSFDQIKDKYYGAYKALIFATYSNIHFVSIESKDKKDEKGDPVVDLIPIHEFAFKHFNECFKELIEPENQTKFKDLFYEYRFTMGECEFNAEDILEMTLFEQEKARSLNSLLNEEQLKKQGKTFAKTILITTSVGAAAGILLHDGFSGLIKDFASYPIPSTKIAQCSKEELGIIYGMVDTFGM